LARSFFEGPADDPAAREKLLGPPDAGAALSEVRSALADLPAPWTVEEVERALRSVAEQSGRKPKAVFQPLRVALTGTTVSPGIFETVALLGRDETLARVDAALEDRKAAA
jgi:glutamyl-tRNA synthetase